MGEVMLHLAHLRAQALAREGAREFLCHSSAFAFVANAIEHERQVRPAPDHVGHLLPKVRTCVLVDRDHVYVPEADAGFREAVTDRLGRETCPVFNAAEALLFSGGKQRPVFN